MTGVASVVLVASAAYFAGQVIAWVMMGSFVAAILFVQTRQAAAFRVAKQRFAGRQTIRTELGARFFGHSELGQVQWRGPGVIVLTPTELWYRLGFPAREFEIPLAAIRVVDVRRVHLGRPSRYKLLYVEAVLNGRVESFAWQIDKPEQWVDLIQRVIAAHYAMSGAPVAQAPHDPTLQPPTPSSPTY